MAAKPRGRNNPASPPRIFSIGVDFDWLAESPETLAEPSEIDQSGGFEQADRCPTDPVDSSLSPTPSRTRRDLGVADPDRPAPPGVAPVEGTSPDGEEDTEPDPRPGDHHRQRRHRTSS